MLMDYTDDKVKKIAKELAIASKRAYIRGIQTGSGGNVSARIPGIDAMLVKASGGSLGDCTAESFLMTDFDGNLLAGSGKPTREALLHGLIYRLCGEIHAVVHVHSPYAIGWSSTKKILPRVTWHTKLKLCADIPTLDIQAPMVRREDFPMVEALFQELPDLQGFLLADHGVVALGKNALEAEHMAELIEETAQVALLGKLAANLLDL